MLRSISVKNYRGFESFRLDGLTRVNLLVGKNNSGKTALLECIHLLASGGDPNVLVEVASRRGETVLAQPGGARMVDLSHFFNGHAIREGSVFSVHSDDGLSRVDAEVVRSEDDQYDPELFDHRALRPAFALAINHERNSDRPSRPFLLTADGAFIIDPRRPYRRYFSDGQKQSSAVRLITPESTHPGLLAEAWNQVILESREAEVVRAMQILEPDISAIFFLAGESGSRPLAGRGGVVVSDKGDKKRIPLGSYGDGMRRLLALAIALIQTKNGFLLIDEIETGFHYSVMADVWELVVKTARESDSQIFATAHSSDCLRGLAALCQRENDLQPDVSVHKIERNLGRSIDFSGDDLVIADEQEIEVR